MFYCNLTWATKHSLAHILRGVAAAAGCLLHLANILRNSSLVQALLIWLVIYANIANIKLHVVVGGGGRLMLHGYYLKTTAYSSQCIMYINDRGLCVQHGGGVGEMLSEVN